MRYIPLVTSPPCHFDAMRGTGCPHRISFHSLIQNTKMCHTDGMFSCLGFIWRDKERTSSPSCLWGLFSTTRGGNPPCHVCLTSSMRRRTPPHPSFARNTRWRGAWHTYNPSPIVSSKGGVLDTLPHLKHETGGLDAPHDPSLKRLKEVRFAHTEIDDDSFPSSLFQTSPFPSLRLLDIEETQVRRLTLGLQLHSPSLEMRQKGAWHPQFLFCHFEQGRGAQHPPCSNRELEPGGLQVSPMPTPLSPEWWRASCSPVYYCR